MFLLRCGSREIPLPQGGCILGRGNDCQVVVEDALASRRHAFLKVTVDKVTVQDLGSRNGVFVNGDRIAGSVVLAVGDELMVGQTQFLLCQGLGEATPSSMPRKANSLRTTAARTEDGPSEPKAGTVERLDVTAHSELLSLLGTVAEKAIAQGRPEQAERLLTRHLNQLLTAARGSRLTDSAELELAAKHGLMLATATLKGSWIDYIFELYLGASRLLPAPIIDGLYETVRKASLLNKSLLERYLDSMRQRSSDMSAAERFLLQRIEGLEQVVRSR